MAVLRNPLVWQLGIGLVFIGLLVSGNPTFSAIAPLVAAAAWGFVLWRFLRLHHLRRQAAIAATSMPDRSPLTVPNISGEITPPSAATHIDPDEMTKYLKSRVIGQDVVGLQIARGIYRRMAQERRGKPVFTVLLTGPTGTGKTEIAKAVASYLYGDERFMFRVDCANVIGEAGLQTLIGSPKGYAGSESWGALTSHLRSTPRTLILFDEIEKAVTSPTAPMAKLLLSLLDEGVCTEQSDGTKVQATESVIFLTSNAAQDRVGLIYEQFSKQPEEIIRATKDVLRDYFAPELLARLDLVTTLAPLEPQSQAKIIALHTGRIAQAYGVQIEELDASFVNEGLRLWSTLEGYGTREIIRWIEQTIADEMIRLKRAGTDRVRLAFLEGHAKADAA